MEERRELNQRLQRDIELLTDKVIEIRRILVGNGKVGVAEMARRSFEHMNQLKATKNGLLDWTFRIAIMVLVGFIAVKVGLK